MIATLSLLGPLTTIFSYPESCRQIGAACMTATDCVGWQAQTCNRGFSDNKACWPPVTNGAYTPSQNTLNGWGFYSPALSCPDGYTKACSATGGTIHSKDFPFQFDVQTGETAIGCCPTDYTCNNDGDLQTCIADITTGRVSTLQCSSGTVVDASILSFPDSITFTSAAENQITKIVAYAPLFQLHHRVSDIPNTAALTSVSTITTPSRYDSPTATTIQTPTSTGSGGGRGFSVAAAAGVGAVMGIVAIAGLVWLIWACLLKKKEKMAEKDRNAMEFPAEMLENLSTVTPGLDAQPPSDPYQHRSEMEATTWTQTDNLQPRENGDSLQYKRTPVFEIQGEHIHEAP